VIRRYWWVAGLLVIVAAVAVLAPMSSSDPDGLERIAIDAGFAEQGADAAYEILPGYSVPFLGGSALSLVVAGLIGVVLIVSAMWLLGRILARRARPTD
jgi:hypothetical protein